MAGEPFSKRRRHAADGHVGRPMVLKSSLRKRMSWCRRSGFCPEHPGSATPRGRRSTESFKTPPRGFREARPPTHGRSNEKDDDPRRNIHSSLEPFCPSPCTRTTRPRLNGCRSDCNGAATLFENRHGMLRRKQRRGQKDPGRLKVTETQASMSGSQGRGRVGYQAAGCNCVSQRSNRNRLARE